MVYNGREPIAIALVLSTPCWRLSPIDRAYLYCIGIVLLQLHTSQLVLVHPPVVLKVVAPGEFL
jgi:hypothetical protein